MSILQLTFTDAIAGTQPLVTEYKDSGLNAARGILITALYSILIWFAFVIVMEYLSIPFRTIVNLSIGALTFAPGAIISVMWLRDGIKGR